MSKNLLIIPLLLFSCFSFSQQLSGTWRVGYIRSIDTILSLDNLEDNTQTEEAFRLGNGIFEFNKGKVVTHNFVEKPNKQKIKNGNSLTFKQKDFIIDTFNEDSVVLRSSEDQEVYMVLIPFDANDVQINARDFIRSAWQIASHSSQLSDIKLHFLDSSNLVFQSQRLEYGYAHQGQWKLIRSGQYSVLSISDREHMKEYMLYCTSSSRNSISAWVSEQRHLEYPAVRQVELVRKQLWPEDDLRNRREQLIGTWQLKRFSPEIKNTTPDTLLSTDFSLQFQPSGRYNLKNETNSIDMEKQFSYKGEESGNWRLSANGTYITMQPDDGWETCFSIYSFENDLLTLDLLYRYRKRASFATRIELVRGK